MKQQADFQFDFALERKAAVHEEDGDLIIEGYAADWLLDRQEETFAPGAFEQGLKAFMERNPILVYHHHYDKALGQVIEAENRPDGLWVKARVDKPTPGSWAEDVYAKIKRGTIRGFSVGGVFHRRLGPTGRPEIYKADMAELSITPFPINPRTLFAVAGKAFGDNEAVADELGRLLDRIEHTLELAEGKAVPTAEQRKKYGMADGSFPIWHCGKGPGGVIAAKNDLGRTNKSREAVMAHVRKRAKALGCPEKARPADEQ